MSTKLAKKSYFNHIQKLVVCFLAHALQLLLKIIKLDHENNSFFIDP